MNSACRSPLFWGAIIVAVLALIAIVVVIAVMAKKPDPDSFDIVSSVTRSNNDSYFEDNYDPIENYTPVISMNEQGERVYGIETFEGTTDLEDLPEYTIVTETTTKVMNQYVPSWRDSFTSVPTLKKKITPVVRKEFECTTPAQDPSETSTQRFFIE